jgi:nucleotide-binding universal stress UspA family protein
MFTKILLAADGSEHSIRATEKAIHLAQQNNSSLQVLYVLDEDHMKSDVLHNWNAVDVTEKRKAAVKPVEELINSSGQDYQVDILRGDPGPLIVQYANKHSFDLVIIGSRGLNPLQEFVLGSVSHKVAKRAECCVLIVK